MLVCIELLMLAACAPPLVVPATPTAPPPPSSRRALIPAPATETPSPQATATANATAPSTPDTSRLPTFDHIYVIVLENEEYGSIVGRSDAPFLNSLIAQYGLATNYNAVAHPSEPNYLALFSGSTQGVTNDGVFDLDGRNLVDQIEAGGKTWKVFAENVPTGCFGGAVGANGEDGPGLYTRKHNPAISFTDISRSPARCANITDLSHFDPAAANYALIVPNACHDMHDCSISAGDTFLQGFVPTIMNSQAWQDEGVLFIVWDEGVTNAGGGGRVPLLVISNLARRGFRYAAASNHYSLLRTIEDAWGMECLNLACDAKNLGEFFQ